MQKFLSTKRPQEADGDLQGSKNESEVEDDSLCGTAIQKVELSHLGKLAILNYLSPERYMYMTMLLVFRALQEGTINNSN